MQNKLKSFGRLLEVMDDLREKCPWDKKQTIESLRILTIEEVYELVDAIDEQDMDGIKEELGDLMLHLVFYSKIASEKGAFDIADVINDVCDKLIARHPHIYGDMKLADEDAVKANWEKIKLREGKTSVLQGVPKSLPAVVKALRIQDKAKQVGFEWENIEQVFEKVEEEFSELNEAVVNGDKQKIEEEFGDLLFALINYSRFLKIDPEQTLEKCNKKFIRRFQYIEQQALQFNKNLTEMTLNEMDSLWNEAKRKE